MAVIKVDFSKRIGTVKPLHGVGQAPFTMTDYSMIRYLKEAGVPFSRLHDVGGAFGGNVYVDIPNLFRDFDADPYDPANYDFTFTDLLLSALVENGVEPFFRLGVTIEGFSHIKYYRIAPPKDFHKWAVICEHVVRHYNEGWADGFRFNIRYWEIWNEPENNHDINHNNMWRGTKEEFFRLYEVAAKHLKACFPEIKVGGYGSCGFYDLTGRPSVNTGSNARYEYLMQFYLEFLESLKRSGAPLDFFSWHNYEWIQPTPIYANFVRKSLDEAGFTEAESICDEWMANTGDKGTAKHAAYITGMILAMQDLPVDSAMAYDGRCGMSIYSVFFDGATRKPYPAYYGLKAFNELYQRKNQVCAENSAPGVYACAAMDADGYLVIVNETPEAVPLELSMDREVDACFRIDDNCFLEPCALPEALDAYSILCVRTK